MSASEKKVSEPKKLTGIFISYRRSDNPDAVGRIYDRLVSEFGKARVFKDVDSIPLGQDFRSHLNSIVGNIGAAVLAIIGPKWTDTRNASGTRRLEDPDDFVRIELEAALARDIPVVPVLVGHAPMPGSAELPGSLTSMAYRQSIEVRPDPDFHHDVTRLVSALKSIIDPGATNASRAEGVTAAAPDPGASEKSPRHWRRFALIIALAGLLVPLVTTFGIPMIQYFRAPPPQELRTDIVTPASAESASFALSPDGRQMVFVATADGASRLWLRSLASTNARPLMGTEGAVAPFWSPDSRSIAFFAGGGLSRIDIAGGASQVLVANAEFAYGGTWNTDGVIVFGSRNKSPLMRMSASGGTPVAVTKFESEQVVQQWPHFLPDGNRFLYTAIGGGEKSGIFLAALDGRTPVRLVAADNASLFLPSGWLLWVRQGALVAQRLDLDKAALIGESVNVASGVRTASVSRTGLVAYRSATAASQRSLIWTDRTGKVLGTAGEPDSTFEDPRVSPDGRRIAVVRNIKGNQDVWLLDGTRQTRLTFAGVEFTPLWSPDGKHVMFMSGRQHQFDLFQKLSSGAGDDEFLTEADGRIRVPSSVSPDGRFLLYFTGDAPNNDMWLLPLSGDHKPAVFLQTPSYEDWGVFSPDGAWVAYESKVSDDRYEIFVRPFVAPGVAGAQRNPGTAQWQVSTAGGTYPVWRPDGKEIYFIDPSGAMMAAPISVRESTLEAGAPIKLFPTRIVSSRLERGRQYDVAPDGRFLINTQFEDAAPPPITLLQNWNPNAGK